MSGAIARDMGKYTPIANQRELVHQFASFFQYRKRRPMDATFLRVTREWLRCDAGDKRHRKRSTPNVVKYHRRKWVQNQVNPEWTFPSRISGYLVMYPFTQFNPRVYLVLYPFWGFTWFCTFFYLF